MTNMPVIHNGKTEQWKDTKWSMLTIQ